MRHSPCSPMAAPSDGAQITPIGVRAACALHGTGAAKRAGSPCRAAAVHDVGAIRTHPAPSPTPRADDPALASFIRKRPRRASHAVQWVTAPTPAPQLRRTGRRRGEVSDQATVAEGAEHSPARRSGAAPCRPRRADAGKPRPLDRVSALLDMPLRHAAAIAGDCRPRVRQAAGGGDGGGARGRLAGVEFRLSRQPPGYRQALRVSADPGAAAHDMMGEPTGMAHRQP